MNFNDYFSGKRVTVMGLGLLGRGVGDALFLAECGAEVIVTDLKSEADLETSVAKLREYKNVTFVLGEHQNEDFANRDLILVAAGVPLNSPYLNYAREQQVPLTQSAALFAKLSKIPIIGVTGTRGKSTVTAMIHHVLEHVTGETVIKGGNIRGVSNLQLLKEVKEDSLAVFELDSWQLQGFGWEGISPQVSVFTNFMADHLNYYPDLETYFADKAHIFDQQHEGDTLVTTPEVLLLVEEFARMRHLQLVQEIVLVDASTITEELVLNIPGEHNRLNASLALHALTASGVTPKESLQYLESFAGVEGRLQYLATINGVKIYNDNNATTAQATKAGLEALAEAKNIVLITGGTDKGIPVGDLPKAISEYCAHTILYSGSGTEVLKKSLTADLSLEEHDTIEACVEAAIATSVPGNVILFSPGFASFNHEFKNEYDRNDKFVAAVEKFNV